MIDGALRMKTPTAHYQRRIPNSLENLKLIPFSCRGRNFCPSCEKKKQLLWAEWPQKEVLEPVPHRHGAIQVDPLVCRQCGGKLKVVAYVSDEISVSASSPDSA